MKTKGSLSIFVIMLFLLTIPGGALGVISSGNPASNPSDINCSNNACDDIQAVLDLPVDEQARTKLLDSYGKLPLTFIENRGQIDRRVKLYEKGSGHSTFFTEKGVFLTLTKSKKVTKEGLVDEKKGLTGSIVKLSPVGGNSAPEIIAEALQEGKVNYFTGNDPEEWKTDLPTYGAVVYKDVYKGIDIKFYGNNRQLEYDVIVKPGADPSKVRLSYEGIEGLEVTEDGALEIALTDGSLYQNKPYIYQEIGGKRVVVDGAFKLLAKEGTKNEVATFDYSFEVASYDTDYPLIIDPVLLYSTYLGGGGTEHGHGIAVDTAGNAYVTGYTDSIDFPVASPIGAAIQGYDVYVTKINAAGNALIYSTYLSGGDNDFGRAIAVDSAGNAYIAGETWSSDFPRSSPIDNTFQGGGEAFVTKINAAGDALVYSTFLGGGGEDQGFAIAVDIDGNAYVTGSTSSGGGGIAFSNFPLVSPIDDIFQGVRDAFVTKINAAGDAFVYSTYLGGNDWDRGRGIAVDSAGNAYITGYTDSVDFPLVSPVDDLLHGYDAFVTKINAAGNAIVYSTYLGGDRSDEGAGIAVDSDGNAYVTGMTSSTDFPLASPIDAIFQEERVSNREAFVTKINAAGDALVYSTYLGGGGFYRYDSEEGRSIAVDSAGNAYVTGMTNSSDFPLVDSIDNTVAGTIDAFITKIDATGSAFVYSTFLGGDGGDDFGRSIAVDIAGNAYVTGSTLSSDFPLASPVDNLYQGTGEAFVAKIDNGNISADIIVDFGPGTGLFARMNNSTWKWLHGRSPDLIAVGNIDGTTEDDLIADFSTGSARGLRVFLNNTSWEGLNDKNPELVATGDIDGNGKEDIIVDFGPAGSGVPNGLFVLMNNASWKRIHTKSPELIATGDIDANGKDDILIDFGPASGGAPSGLLAWMNNASWKLIHAKSPELIATGNIDGDANGKADILIDFGPVAGGLPYGLFARMNNASWKLIHAKSPELIATGNIDGDANGKDDIIIDFGPASSGAPHGLLAKMNNASWKRIHTKSPELIATGNIDGDVSGKDDILIDFGPASGGAPSGFFARMNNASWKVIHPKSPELIVTGEIDGK